ncbi:MAG: hypothetical protein MK081_12750 [Flavobacteriales bacterium]|nr:hypothetical protein [Flavobacteriales bacterium]
MIIHSSTWYPPIRIDFVDGANGTPLSISSISFLNPIDSEIDVIVLEAYDANNNLLATYARNSPEEVVFDYGSPDIFYVILDDVNDESAYVIDNIEIVQNGVSVNESSTTLAPRFCPNPFEHTLTVDRIEIGDKIELFDVTSRMVYALQASSSQIIIAGDRLAAGRYLLKIFRDGVPILTEAVKR